MLGRQVGSSLLRLRINARPLVLRSASLQCTYQRDLPIRVLIASPRRSYATPGRPRKTVGEPSTTVKRSVKRAAKSSEGGEAASQNAARRSTGRGKKSTTKKATAKPKAKSRPKKKVPKELTPEQQEAKDTRVARAKRTELRKLALSPPADGSGIGAHSMFLREKLKGMKLDGSDSRPQQLGDMSKSVNQEWRDLTPAELEHYNHQAVQERQNLRAEHKRWVESHTPEQIRAANRARNQLRRQLPNAKGKKRYLTIKDERAVKRPVSAFMQFSINRNASGDFRNISGRDRAKLIGQEWRALSESEKKKYKDLGSEDLSRYQSEYTSVFGHEPPYQQAAAAAA